jgi:prenylcysteine oxidase/farnesylcysteine lyase
VVLSKECCSTLIRGAINEIAWRFPCDPTVLQDTWINIILSLALISNFYAGAGAGGSSAAYHLRKFATQSGVDVDITVYEKASYIGGRSTTVNAYNNAHFPVEVGGSIFVATNEILKNFTIEHGLRAEDSETEYDDILGIWDGLSFVHIMKDSGWQWWDNAKLLWKYGMAPIKTVRLMRTVVGKFKQLYSPPFFPFRSLSDRVEDLGLLPVTGVTGEQYLKQNGVRPSP